MSRRSILTLGATRIVLDVHPEVEGAFAGVRRFFRHSVQEDAAQVALDAADLELLVMPYDRELADEIRASGRPVDIRRSAAAAFDLRAHVHRSERFARYANDTTVLEAPLRLEAGGRLVVGVSDGSVVQLIDLIRDIAIRMEESRGTVVLHAAAVRRDGEVVAIAGPKGAGKTTTMLASLQSGWSYHSGDKLLCRMRDGRLEVQPWRDYPYLGFGTLRLHPELAVRVAEWSGVDVVSQDPRSKVLVDPDEFEACIGAEFDPTPLPLRAIVLPQVRPVAPLDVERVDDVDERWAVLNQVVERSCDATFFTWQTYFVPTYEAMFRTLTLMRSALDGIDMLRLRGSISQIDVTRLLGRATVSAAS